MSAPSASARSFCWHTILGRLIIPQSVDSPSRYAGTNFFRLRDPSQGDVLYNVLMKLRAIESPLGHGSLHETRAHLIGPYPRACVVDGDGLREHERAALRRGVGTASRSGDHSRYGDYVDYVAVPLTHHHG